MNELLDFDCPIDLAPGRRIVVSTDVQPVTETVTVRSTASAATAYLAKPTEHWDWPEVRDYVVHQIETVHGPFPRDTVKENAIFKSFVGRHGERAQSIARFAFEIAGGYWKGSPIGVTRFCKASDQYFAAEIIKKIAAAQPNA